jgi:hypothetical protein
MKMTDSTRSVHDHTDDLRRASKTLADRIDAVAEEVTRARARLGRRFRRVEDAIAEAREDAAEPNTKLTAALPKLRTNRDAETPSPLPVLPVGAAYRYFV